VCVFRLCGYLGYLYIDGLSKISLIIVFLGGITVSLERIREQASIIASLLKLRTSPVGIHFLEREPDRTAIPGFRPLRDFHRRMAFCQAAAISRYYKWPILMGKEDFSCPGALIVFGLVEIPSYFEDGSISEGLYTRSKDLGAKLDSHLVKLPANRYKGLAIFSLEQPVVRPHVILLYLTPGQLSRVTVGFTYFTGEPLEMKALGKAGSCSGVAKAFMENRPVAILPGLGDRTLAWTMDDEMAIAFPADILEPLIEALKEQEKTDVLTYPPKPYLFYEFKFKNIPIIGKYYDKFLKEVHEDER